MERVLEKECERGRQTDKQADRRTSRQTNSLSLALPPLARSSLPRSPSRTLPLSRSSLSGTATWTSSLYLSPFPARSLALSVPTSPFAPHLFLCLQVPQPGQADPLRQQGRARQRLLLQPRGLQRDGRDGGREGGREGEMEGGKQGGRDSDSDRDRDRDRHRPSWADVHGRQVPGGGGATGQIRRLHAPRQRRACASTLRPSKTDVVGFVKVSD